MARRLASGAGSTRVCTQITPGARTPCGDPDIPVSLAGSPRLRRFTAIWVAELRRQWGIDEAHL